MSTFSTRTLVRVHKKVLGQFSQPNFENFHIETTDDTIESLKCVVGIVFKFLTVV